MKPERRPWTRSLAVFLVLSLSLGPAAAPTRAMITEVIVGGTLVLQTLSVLAELLPQINALAANVFDIFKTGKEVAGSLGELLGPRKTPAGGSASSAQPSSGQSNSEPVVIDVPVILPFKPRPQEPETEEPADEQPNDGNIDTDDGVENDESTVNDGDQTLPEAMADQVGLLVRTWAQRSRLLEDLHLDSSEGDGNLPVNATTSLYEALAEMLASDLVGAFESEDFSKLESFLALAEPLETPDLPALRPVLKSFVEACRFKILHDSTRGDQPSYKRMEDLYRVIRAAS